MTTTTAYPTVDMLTALADMIEVATSLAPHGKLTRVDKRRGNLEFTFNNGLNVSIYITLGGEHQMTFSDGRYVDQLSARMVISILILLAIDVDSIA